MSLKVATVKYLNALPFLSALEELVLRGIVELVEATPSVCADLLQKDQVDLALIPVGAISDFEKLFIVSNYCISCDGHVRTVKLFSEYPISEIQQIVLDDSSRSSNLLVQILCKKFWKRPEIVFVEKEGSHTALKTGFLKIGDDVFEMENQFQHEYDLGDEWKNFTGLPFVFAIWVSKRDIDRQELTIINESFQKHLARLTELVSNNPALKRIHLDGYFEKNIYYELDEQRRSGLKKFFELARLSNPLQKL